MKIFNGKTLVDINHRSDRVEGERARALVQPRFRQIRSDIIKKLAHCPPFPQIVDPSILYEGDTLHRVDVFESKVLEEMLIVSGVTVTIYDTRIARASIKACTTRQRDNIHRTLLENIDGTLPIDRDCAALGMPELSLSGDLGSPDGRDFFAYSHLFLVATADRRPASN